MHNIALVKMLTGALLLVSLSVDCMLAGSNECLPGYEEVTYTLIDGASEQVVDMSNCYDKVRRASKCDNFAVCIKTPFAHMPYSCACLKRSSCPENDQTDLACGSDRTNHE